MNLNLPLDRSDALRVHDPQHCMYTVLMNRVLRFFVALVLFLLLVIPVWWNPGPVSLDSIDADYSGFIRDGRLAGKRVSAEGVLEFRKWIEGRSSFPGTSSGSISLTTPSVTDTDCRSGRHPWVNSPVVAVTRFIRPGKPSSSGWNMMAGTRFCGRISRRRNWKKRLKNT